LIDDGENDQDYAADKEDPFGKSQQAIELIKIVFCEQGHRQQML
jgi:hypothetical protein